MALKWNIKITSTTNGGIRQGATQNSVSSTQSTQYRCEAFDDGEIPLLLNPNEITEQDAFQAVDATDPTLKIPIANFDVFRWKDRFSPYLVCSTKQATRDPNNGYLWTVNVGYQTQTKFGLPEHTLYLEPLPVTIDDIGYIQEIVYSDDERILEDELGTSPDRKTMRTPTGNRYSQPFVEITTRQTVRQTQFEAFASVPDVHDAILARRKTTQDRPYRNEGSADKPLYMIREIDWLFVQIPLASGSYAGASMMTYTIDRSNKPHGWLDDRALIDTHYLDTAGDLTSKREASTAEGGLTLDYVYLNSDGTLKDDQLGLPTYDQWRVQPDATHPSGSAGDSWDFLQGTTPP